VSARLAGLAAWAVVGFLLAPLVAIIGASFTETPYAAFPPVGFTLRWYGVLLHRQDVLGSVGVSVLVAVLCTVAATALGVPAAVGLRRHGNAAVQALLVSPLVLPTVVTGVALLQFYTLIGLDAPFAGLVAAHVVITVPYVVRTVGAGLARLDPALEEAAETLGAGPARVLLRVTLPAVSPSILAAVVFVFVTSFDQATVSIFLSGPDLVPLPVRLLNAIEFAVDPSIAAVSTLLILAAFGLVALLQRLLRLDRTFGG